MLNRSIRYSILIILLTLGVFGSVFAQDSIPNAPNPPRLVNDFAGILQPEQVQALEQRVVAFNDSTSTQIAVVIVPSLKGYDKSDFAQRLGQKWGVGGSKFDNGFVILIKPKSNTEKGEAFIATGYGVEALVPDATAYQVVNREMIPYFERNDYYGGIDAAITALEKFTKGEFKANTYGKAKEGGKGILIALIIFIVLFVIFTRNNRNHHDTIGKSSSIWPLFWLGGMGGWGNSSGGGGFGGGGGGGFGGFGGGGFGGGGAGGSW